MAAKLPQFIVIKPIYADYACFMTTPEERRGFISCSEMDVTSVLAKIEVEKSKFHSNYVHLRFCHNNRYWGKLRNDVWMFASSKKPVEDKSSPSCTLFEPSTGADGYLYLKHVQSGGYARVRTNLESPDDGLRLFVDSTGPRGHSHAFSFVDWDTLVQMPENVAFKGDNGKYLGLYWIEGHPYLHFGADDSNDERTAQVVKKAWDGSVKIFSKYEGKYWRRSPNWIWADTPDGSWKDVLFWPVKVDDTTIALRNEGNKMFCKRLTTEGKTSCLNAAVSTITREARLNVVELVSERKIYDVVYRLDDARIYDEKAFIAGTGSAVNDSSEKASLTIKVTYKEDTSYSFKNSLALKLGVKTSIKAGFPFIADGEIEVSAEVATTLEWNKTITNSKTAEASYQASVPPKSRVRVDYIATRGTCDVPFNYTRRDKSSTTGNFVTTLNIDGHYTGVSCYNFYFSQPKTEPLRK